jgi:hypothetical protein
MGTNANATAVYRMVLKCNAWEKEARRSAHPQLMQDRGVPSGAWPGGYCNQADRSEDLNADLL